MLFASLDYTICSFVFEAITTLCSFLLGSRFWFIVYKYSYISLGRGCEHLCSTQFCQHSNFGCFNNEFPLGQFVTFNLLLTFVPVVSVGPTASGTRPAVFQSRLPLETCFIACYLLRHVKAIKKRFQYFLLLV
jgi:hypothetical protein